MLAKQLQHQSDPNVPDDDKDGMDAERAAPEGGDDCSSDAETDDVKSAADWNDERCPVDDGDLRLQSRALKNCCSRRTVDVD